MRFICDVCPTTASGGHTVIIGHYEQWVRHLLSPQHQAEQNLAITRTSYWPQSDWIALIKDLPVYDETTGELFVDLMLNLSEYGFIEALYYGSKMKDTVCVALQLYETNPCPSYLKSPEDGAKYELKIAPRIPTDFINGQKCSKMGKRRLRYNSIASTIDDTSTCTSYTDAATSPIASSDSESVKDTDALDLNTKMKDLGTRMDDGKRSRIKYDRDTLLQFYNQTACPVRLVDILTLTPIIVEEPQFIDPECQRQSLQWSVASVGRNPTFLARPNGTNTNPKNAAYFKNGNRQTTGNDRTLYKQRHPHNQSGWNMQNNTRWTRDQDQQQVEKPKNDDEEEW